MQPAPPRTSSAFSRAILDLREPAATFPDISARWLLSAAGVVLLAAAAFAWLTLCLLYWQGSWQILYHPTTSITQTPASVGLQFEPVSFAVTESGQTQLTGWWIPVINSHRTILYLHGADGNLSNTVPAIAALHQQAVNIFAIDYRNYGQSQTAVPARPSEKQLRQDAEWALTWLTLTRHVDPKQIVVYGSDLGANLAADLAADHGELAGVILDQPIPAPLAPLFTDPRSRLVPAKTLVQDKYDLAKAAKVFQIPSLWLIGQTVGQKTETPDAFPQTRIKRTAVYLNRPIRSDPHYQQELARWLDDL